MPRTARAVEAGTIYHVLNRGNARQRIFRKKADFAAFERVLGEGLERYPVDLLTYCLMDNHWHLVLRPRRDDALGRLVGWIGVTHVRRHHEHYQLVGTGHLYQGRFKSFPVQDDPHLLTLCRYVEANAVRAGMVAKAEQWEWAGSFARANGGKPLKMTDWPVARPTNWLQLLNRDIKPPDLDRLRVSVQRGQPFGEETWVKRTAKRLGLEFTLRQRGRPKAGKQAARKNE